MSPTPSKILVSTDFSKPSEHALDYAIGLAQKLSAEVIVLHAYELPMVLAIVGVVIQAGTMNLNGIVAMSEPRRAASMT